MATMNLMIGQFNHGLLQKMSLGIIFIIGSSMTFMNLTPKVLLLMTPRNASTTSHTVCLIIYESLFHDVNACKITPTNMRASADIIWRTFQTFHGNDDLDSLASEEEEEELSSEDFESGEEEGEDVDVDYAQQLIDRRNREMKERKEQNYQKFKVEVFDSISRCLDHNLNSLDIQKEISGSRSSYEMDAPQIIQAVAETLFTKATNNGSFDLKKFKEVSF